MMSKMIEKVKIMYGMMLKKYPVTSVMVLIGTIYESLFAGFGLGYNHKLVNTWGFVLGFLALAQVACWFVESLPEKVSKNAKRTGFIVNVVLALVFDIICSGHFFEVEVDLLNNISENRLFMWLFAYIAIQVILVLKFKFEESNLKFEQYITGAFVKALQICIVWSVLALGLLVLCFVFSELIIDMNDWMLVPQILVMGLYVIPAAIMALSKVEDKINKFFEGLIRYVILIMTVIGAIIIYMYMVKILAVREIPSNSVFSILAVLFFVAIPTGYMCTSFAKEGVLQKIAWNLPYIYAPFIILQIYSVATRIAQYGVTASRYMGIVLIILEIIYIVVYAVKRDNMPKMLYCFLAATVISCLVPGINAMSLARINQKAIVNKYINDPAYGMSNAKKVVGAYQYLLEEEGEDYVDAILTKEQQSAISDMSLMSGQYVFRDFSERAYLNADDSFIPVKGYEYIAGFDAYWQDYYDLTDFPIEIDGIEVGRFDMTDEIASVMARHEQNNNDSTIYGVDEVVVSDDCKLYVTYVEVVYDKDSREISSMRISGHIVFNEDYLKGYVMD